jgi:hypothetical protein
MKTKEIIIKEDGKQTTFETKGLTDFEVVGMLSYYVEVIKLKMLKETTNQNEN